MAPPRRLPCSLLRGWGWGAAAQSQICSPPLLKSTLQEEWGRRRGERREAPKPSQGSYWSVLGAANQKGLCLLSKADEALGKALCCSASAFPSAL